jgi:hypothetical protein
LMPISRQARMMRRAISPRLAMRTFENMVQVSGFRLQVSGLGFQGLEALLLLTPEA